jgi:glutamyl-tRNA reductase
MELFVLGTSQSVASARVRERMHVDLDRVYGAVSELMARGVLEEAVPLATCGRLELYCVAEDPDRALALLRRLVLAYAELPGEELDGCTYVHRGEAAVRHLFRVAAGLDSVVHGEVQILGQVRGALHHPSTAVSAGPLLHRLLQRALGAGKRVRTETEIGRGAASIAGAALSMLQREVGSLEPVTAVVLGAGDTGALMARLLAKSGIGRLVVANRTVDRARELAAELGCEAAPLADLPDLLARAELVVGAVTARDRLVTPETLPDGADWPSFFLDLAHPRNFAPELASVSGVRVFDLDHVFDRVESARAERARQVPQAEAIVTEETEEFVQWLRCRENVSVLTAVRSQVLELAQSVAERHARGRSEGEREEMRMLARSLARTLLHPPTMALREADPGSTEGRWLLESAATLFGVQDESPDDDISVNGNTAASR